MKSVTNSGEETVEEVLRRASQSLALVGELADACVAAAGSHEPTLSPDGWAALQRICAAAAHDIRAVLHTIPVEVVNLDVKPWSTLRQG